MSVHTTAVLLFAHGARDPRWSGPFQAVAAALRAQRPHQLMELAFLEFMSPTLPEAAESLIHQGALVLEIVPMFLGAGGHVRKDLPNLMVDIQARHPQVQLKLHPAIGEMPEVVNAMAAAIAQAVEHPAAGGAAPGV